MRRTLDQVARMCALAAFVAWVALLAMALGATAEADGATSSEERPRIEQRRDAPQTSVDEVSRDVMCPSCDSTLDQSNSPAAERMRDWVREAVAAGWTEEEIRDGLVEQYDGDESVLATPRATGLGLAVWVVPALVVLIAAIGGAIVLRSWRRPTAQARAQTRSGSSSNSHSSTSTPSTGSPASSSEDPAPPSPM